MMTPKKPQSYTERFSERARASLEGRRVRIPESQCVWIVTRVRDLSAPVPLDEFPGAAGTACVVPDAVPGLNPWRPSTWAPGISRDVPASECVPVSPARAPDEHPHGCRVQPLRFAWDDTSRRVRALNCICGADPLDATASVRDSADETVTEDRVELPPVRS